MSRPTRALNLQIFRDAIFYPSRDVAIQFTRFESGRLQHLGYPSREGVIHDMKELKQRLLNEWRLLDHTIIVAEITQLCSRLKSRAP